MLLALVIYVLVTVLAFGLQARESLAGLHNPSMALLMEQLLGEPGKYIIAIGLVISGPNAELARPWTGQGERCGQRRSAGIAGHDVALRRE